MSDITKIEVKKETAIRLNGYRGYADSYDKIINRVLDIVEGIEDNNEEVKEDIIS